MSVATTRQERAPSFREVPEQGFWGMLGFISTEATFFVMLIAAYFYLAGEASSWPPDGIAKPELPLPIVNTVILLASSGPMFYATRQLRRGHMRGVIGGLLSSAVLGAVFIAIQAYELDHLEFSARSNAYGSAFITLTGFHLAHLVVGIALVLYAVLRTMAGHFDAEHRLGIENTALYWHFVDVVWIAVFLTVHISPWALGRS